MTATNHALTGAVIGLIVGEPLLALPLAVVSHYICDMLPHFGTGLPFAKVMKSNWFKNYLYTEAFLCFLIVLTLFLLQPTHWLLASVCATLAALPDWLSFNRFITTRRHKVYKPGWYTRFASGIQWFERPIGAAVETAWFVAMLVILVPIVKY